MPNDELMEKVLDGLVGSRDEFRKDLEPERILLRVCRYAALRAKRMGSEPWAVISDITGHGSGVSKAIYELYRERKDGTT